MKEFHATPTMSFKDVVNRHQNQRKKANALDEIILCYLKYTPELRGCLMWGYLSKIIAFKLTVFLHKKLQGEYF